jgi:hypothetical protein
MNNTSGSQEDWLYLSPLFAHVKRIRAESLNYVQEVEDVISFAYGHRLLDALPLAVPWLRARGLRLTESLGYGTYGRAFLTDASTVVKITTQREEYEAARKLAGMNVPNVVHVYAADPLGSVRSWDYFILETEFLAPTEWPVGRTVPAAAGDAIQRGCENYQQVTGKRCDRHNENFGLNARGEWTLLDLGPSTHPFLR